jgi:hypothetical protein
MASTINATPTSSGLISTADNTGVLALQTGGTTAVTVDSSQNVGVGTASPVGKLHINQAGGVAAISQTYAVANFQNSFGAGGDALVTLTGSNQGIIAALNASQGAVPMTFYTGQTERMRIDTAGRVLIGTTNTSPASNDVYGIALGAAGGGGASPGPIQASANGSSALLLNRGSDNGNTAAFYRSGTNVGTISVTASATAYNTSSDYRLKENIAPMTGALSKVALLKPCTYTWKASQEDSQGFIAHELAEVVPDAVNGEKDAVDTEGNPVYQGIDTSFLVATLTAAIQELNAKVDAQALEIQALKGVA